MPRAAGDSPYYTFYLNGDKDGPKIELPSVTTIIKVVLSGSFTQAAWWGYKVAAAAHAKQRDLTDPTVLKKYDALKATNITPNTVRDEAAGRGIDAHAYLEKLAVWAMGAGDAPTPESGYEYAIQKWYDTEKPDVLASERVLYSMEKGFAGTCDLKIGHRIVDLKTRKLGTEKAYETDHIQTSGYAVADEEMTGDHIHDTAVLIAMEDGTYLYEVQPVRRELFLSILDVYNQLERMKA